jgi:hypothetical protein
MSAVRCMLKLTSSRRSCSVRYRTYSRPTPHFAGCGTDPPVEWRDRLRRNVNAVSSRSRKVYSASPGGFFDGIRRIALVAQNAFSAFRTIHHMTGGERGLQGIAFGKRLRTEFRPAEPAHYEQFLDSWHLQPCLVARTVPSAHRSSNSRLHCPMPIIHKNRTGFGAGGSRARPVSV